MNINQFDVSMSVDIGCPALPVGQVNNLTHTRACAVDINWPGR